MEKVQITRRSTVGFGYETSAKQTEHGLRVIETTKPYHTGTPRQVIEDIKNDRTYKSLQQGTYYSTAWFVKVDKKWRRLVDPQYVGIADLFQKNYRDELPASITIEVE